MIEVKGNIWDYYNKAGYAIAITTNGTIKKDGTAVMGAGVAKEAMEQFPDIPFTLGKSLQIAGNNLHYLGNNIISFPVKHQWWEKADLALIQQSCHQLMNFINNCKSEVEFAHINKVVLVRPGCGNGKLDYESQVKPVISQILDDRIEVITYE